MKGNLKDFNNLNHRKETISGLKWNLLNQTISQAVIFAIGIILMRLLEPSEFGLVGMVTVFSGFLSIFSDFGLSSSLIQKKEIDDLDKNTIFWVSIFFGAVLTVSLILISPLIASFYNEDSLVLISVCLASTYLVQSIGATHGALLRKRMLFKKYFWVTTTPVLSAGILSTLAAFYGLGVWALVIQPIASNIVQTILLWLLSDFRPKFEISRERLSNHLKFGFPLLGTKTIQYWVSNADNLIIGRLLGVQALGIYSRGYSIVTIPTRRIGQVITMVMFSSFSIIQEDKQRVKTIFLKLNRIISSVIFPAMGILFCIASPLTISVFGEKWIEIVTVLQLLSIVACVKSISILNSNIMVSQGKTGLDFRINMITGILVIGGFIIGAQFGINEVAAAYLISVTLATIPGWYIAGKSINCKLMEQFNNILPQIIIFGILSFCGLWIMNHLETYPAFIKIVFVSLLYIFMWVVLMRVFYHSHFKEVIMLRTEFVKKVK